MACLASREGRHLQRYTEGCRQVVGCIPYRYKNPDQLPTVAGTLLEEIEVLLVSSQKSERMMFPKGGWEIDESIEEAALRETREEAGVLGVVQSKLGKWSFQSKSKFKVHEGHMFPLLVEEQLHDYWPEKDIRRRRWMGVGEARATCDASWMREALDVFEGRMKQWRMEEEENERRACLFGGFLRTEDIVMPQNVEDEDEDEDEDEEEEEENERSACLLGFLRTEDIVMPQNGENEEEEVEEEEVEEEGYQEGGENIQSTTKCSSFSNSQFSKELRSCLEMQMLMVQD